MTNGKKHIGGGYRKNFPRKKSAFLKLALVEKPQNIYRTFIEHFNRDFQKCEAKYRTFVEKVSHFFVGFVGKLLKYHYNVTISLWRVAAQLLMKS